MTIPTSRMRFIALSSALLAAGLPGARAATVGDISVMEPGLSAAPADDGAGAGAGGQVIQVSVGETLSGATGTSLELKDTLLVNNGTVSGTLNVNSGGVAKGSGTFGMVNVTGGGMIAPGNSPGTANVTSLTFASGGTYQFELNSANATPGNGADFINDLGVLSITAGNTPNTVFSIAVISLNGANQPSALTDFDSSLPYSFTLVTAAGGITGFAADEFSVDTTGFANNLRGGAFSVAQQGNNLVLNFIPVPEPTTTVMLLGALAFLGLRRPGIRSAQRKISPSGRPCALSHPCAKTAQPRTRDLVP